MATTETHVPNIDADKNRQPQPIQPARRNSRWSGYRHLLWARILELKREPEVVFWVFLFPLLLACGTWASPSVAPRHVPIVADRPGPGAAAVLQLAQGSRQSLHARIVPEADALDAFPPRPLRLSSSFHKEPRPDDSHPLKSNIATIRPAPRAFSPAPRRRPAGRRRASNPLPASAQASSEPGARYIDFLIPGLLGMNLMNSGMWGVGFALVDYRQRKLLKRYVATPMRRGDFLLALMTSRLVLMIPELGLLLAFGIFVFHMRVAGSWLAILLLATLGAATFAGLGLLTASRAQKIESVSGLINLVMMPMWIFSGVFFSYDRFPAIIHPFIKALPLTALNDALRATILEGATLSSQWGQLLVLAVWGGVSFVLALRWFRWT